MVKVSVGDRVMVWHRGSEPREATVTKVARVWITTGEGRFAHRFRLDDQTDGSQTGYMERFYTLEQWAEKERQGAAQAYLRKQGIDLRYESPWRKRVVELAEALRQLDIISAASDLSA